MAAISTSEQCSKITFVKQNLSVNDALRFTNALVANRAVKMTGSKASNKGNIYEASIIDDEIVIYGEETTMATVSASVASITEASQILRCEDLEEDSP